METICGRTKNPMKRFDDNIEDLRSSSQVSIGFPEFSNTVLNKDRLLSTNIPIVSDKNLPITDQCCIGLFCAKHEKLAAAKLKNKGLFLPNFIIKNSDSWFDVADRSIQQLFQALNLNQPIILLENQLFNITRIQLPKKYPHYLTRVTFVSIISHEDKICIQSEPNPFSWYTLNQLRNEDTLWGIEPIELFYVLKETADKISKQNFGKKLSTTLNEYEQNEAIRFIEMSNDFQAERELLLSAKFTIDNIYKLYNEFIMQCFPSRYMTYQSFKIFMKKIGWLNDEEILYRMVFHSFTSSTDYSTKYERLVPFLEFEQLIIGLAIMEERTDHRGNCLRFRLRYIFHFYDTDKDNILNENEIRHMITDINNTIRSNDNNSRSSKTLFEASLSEIYRRFNVNDSITYEQFMQSTYSDLNCSWIAELTDTLFRSSISSIDVASVKFNYKIKPELSSTLTAMTLANNYDEPCEQCKLIKFNMCAHGIKIDGSGSILGIIKFNLGSLYKDTPFTQELSVTELEFNMINTELNRISQIAIEILNLSNEELAIHRKSNEQMIINNIRQIIKMAKNIIKVEPIIIYCESPCMIISEIWSNLYNLHKLMSSFTRMSPFVNQMNCIFLGNYIDPDSCFGIECFIYLLCYKILMPKRIYLLRGSNELRKRISNRSLFRKDCTDCFNVDIFNDILDLFDLLPIVAVVDHRLFLSKSGIPRKKKSLKEFSELNPTQKVPIVKFNSVLKNIM